MKKINLGCAGFYDPSFINLDWNPVVESDIRHDLNQFPYPFESESVDHIRAFHIIEHLYEPFKVMEEFHRILKKGGTAHIKVPHFSRGFTHAEHKRGFDVAFPFYFNKTFEQSGYFGTDFELVEMKLNWLGNVHLLKHINIHPLQLSILSVLNKVISFFANLNPFVCSRIWSFWVGGFDEIEFHFKKN